MEAVVLAIHLIIAIALVGVILVQRSEGGGLGIGGGGMGNFMTVRGTANLLTRTTAILATLFMLTSMALTMMGGGHNRQQRSILDEMNTPGQSAPAIPAPPIEGQAPALPAVPPSASPAAPAPAVPASPAEPAPPMGQ
jgi:preprotein translocase subunit SecG